VVALTLEEGELVISKPLQVLSSGPSAAFVALHPLSGGEAHIAFGLAVFVAVIGICNMLIGLARNWRRYRNGS
jgi:hypothetical protein